MFIRDMFEEDIDRKINGVIKVNQDADEVVEQEVREYVVTNDLKEHFDKFFQKFANSFSEPEGQIGVWISGFFGSGKSHFLKMTSYLLENRKIKGNSIAQIFRKKFEKFGDSVSLIHFDKIVGAKVETILFNIEVENNSDNNDDRPVLHVFAKMFYNHLGFFGSNLKVVELEKYIEEEGKTEEFRRVFEEKSGSSWTEKRENFAFIGKHVVPTLCEVLDISLLDAQNWYDNRKEENFSIESFVKDIKKHVDSKPNDYRLVFMIDEVGQFVGESKTKLLNLQSIVEEISAKCGGKVWVVCTGQEAIDEVINVKDNELSRILARFNTRLSFSSSSASEVIQRRILTKNAKATKVLQSVYAGNDAAMRNLLTFKDAVSDLKHFRDADDFIVNYPFIPYQFILMPFVFRGIRIHGATGKHLSGGERSLLSAFQEAAQRLKERNEYALAPFFYFYDTIQSFLDSSIRMVVNRCQKAADDPENILEQFDVDVLKLLYLVLYLGKGVPANVNNVAIMMIDSINVDIVELREKVKTALERLVKENYVGRVGDSYQFLTDEEQDVARGVSHTDVSSAEVVARIKARLFEDIYVQKKIRFGKKDFEFEQCVDNGAVNPDKIALRFLTAAAAPEARHPLNLSAESLQQAIVVLDGSDYYELTEQALKIRSYVRKNASRFSTESIQKILEAQNRQADRYEEDAKDLLIKAIESAVIYVAGQQIEPKGNFAKRLDEAMETLIKQVYVKMDYIEKACENDGDIRAVLRGDDVKFDESFEKNLRAANEIEDFLKIQAAKGVETTMNVIQKRYQGIHYGWREIDVAWVVALLLRQQKVSVEYAGSVVSLDDANLPNYLQKRSEINKTKIKIRQRVKENNLRKVKVLLRELFSIQNVPEDEDGMKSFICKHFEIRRNTLLEREKDYERQSAYPDREVVTKALELTRGILKVSKDNIALFNALVKQEDALLENAEELQRVEDFFKSQSGVFDSALNLLEEMKPQRELMAINSEVTKALDAIESIVKPRGKFDYKCVPEIVELSKTVRDGWTPLLISKRDELQEFAQQCLDSIVDAAKGKSKAALILDEAKKYFEKKKLEIDRQENLALLDALKVQLGNKQSGFIKQIESALSLPTPFAKSAPAKKKQDGAPPLKIKKCSRQVLFLSKTLKSEAEIDEYVESIRRKLKELLAGNDALELN